MADADRKAPTKGGRPRAAEPGSTVSFYVPVSTHDRIVQLAQQQGTTVSALLKAWVSSKVK